MVKLERKQFDGSLRVALIRKGWETFRMLAASMVVSPAFSGMMATHRRHGFQNFH